MHIVSISQFNCTNSVKLCLQGQYVLVNTVLNGKIGQFRQIYVAVAYR